MQGVKIKERTKSVEGGNAGEGPHGELRGTTEVYWYDKWKNVRKKGTGNIQ